MVVSTNARRPTRQQAAIPTKVFPAPQGNTTMPLLATSSRENILDKAPDWRDIGKIAEFLWLVGIGCWDIWICNVPSIFDAYGLTPTSSHVPLHGDLGTSCLHKYNTPMVQTVQRVKSLRKSYASCIRLEPLHDYPSSSSACFPDIPSPLENWTRRITLSHWPPKKTLKSVLV